MLEEDVYSSDHQWIYKTAKKEREPGGAWSDGGSTLRNVGCDPVVVADLWVWSLKTHGLPPRPCLIACLPRGETVNCSWGILCHTALLLLFLLLKNWILELVVGVLGAPPHWDVLLPERWGCCELFVASLGDWT